MGRLIAIIILAVAAFLLGVVAPLAFTGNLNQDSLSRLMGKEPEAVPEPEADAAGPLLSELKRERERLDTWESELQQREELLAIREQEVFTSLDELVKLQEEINLALDTLDAEQAEGYEEVAKSLAAMTPEEAAEDLESMRPEEAARLLPLIEERKRGKILDVMEDKQKRGLILQIMQERKY